MYGKRNLVNVYLGGKLGQLFGEKWSLLVSSPADAIHAIDVNLRGKLRRYLQTEGMAQYYRVAVGSPEQGLDEEELTSPVGSCDIYFYPVVGGRNSGTAKLLVGIALLAIVTIATYGYGSTLFVGAHGLTLLGSVTVGVGTSLVLGGIAQMLAPHPKDNGGELGSNVFQGTISQGEQGGSVPVVYGRALVSPLSISIWFTNLDYNTTTNSYVGTVEAVNLPGGGTQYFVPDPSAVTPSQQDAGA